MLKKLKSLFSFWPLFSLLALNIILFATNYIPGTYLTGWDNLHPELLPLTNIKRSIFAVWQEYQSLGLLGGMGHATDIVRQIYVLLLSFVVPLDLIRYITTFTSLFLGGVGAYYLIRLVLAESHFDNNRTKAASFLGSVFYTLNIATIQTFYVPFEAFTAHFAALPWLLLSSIIFLGKTDKKSFGLLIAVLILSLTAAYIPTLFVAFLIVLSIYIGVRFLLESKKKAFFLKSIYLYLIIGIVNSFWLLPFFYFTLTNSAVNVGAKMNQMATETIFAQNREFGNLLDVALLRGFWFNNVDPNINGDFAYMLAPWREHFDNPYVVATALFLFGIAVVGAILSLIKLFVSRGERKQIKKFLPFVVLFIFGFTMLATDAPIFSLINKIFREFPLFEQAFRFPFTKFNSTAALFYSVMLAIGFTLITDIIYKRVKKILPYILFLVPFAAVVYVAAPAFAGNLFYEKEVISIPNEYFETFEFFKNQDPNTRIANLPQPTFWGWTFYRWGYGGSGFLWYGLNQPILDRAFDVWSTTSENYYFELSQALYSKDPQSVDRILNKYQVSWIIVDKNVIYPNSPRSLIYDETDSILSQIPIVEKAAAFGNIDIYRVELINNPKSFVFTEGILPKVTTTKWNTIDKAYIELGNYAEGKDQSYIFGSLFSQKQASDQEFEMYENERNIEITKIVTVPNESSLQVPNFYENENIIPITLSATPSDENVIIHANIATPEILINRERVYGASLPINLITLPSTTTYPVNIDINGISSFTIDEAPGTAGIIGTGFLTLLQDNTITIVNDEISESATIPMSQIQNMASAQEIEIDAGRNEISVITPKINDNYLSYAADLENSAVSDCNNFRNGIIESTYTNKTLAINSTNDSACVAFFAADLFHNLGYAIFTEGSNSSGRPFHFWILNEDNKSAVLDTYFDARLSNSYVIAPLGDDGRGYSFHLDNVSYGSHKVTNSISSFTVYPISFNFISKIKLTTNSTVTSENTAETIDISHPNESLYVASIKSDNPYTLVLSQSYDTGWKAYLVDKANLINKALPFVFGTEIKAHHKINNWANGWEINDSETLNDESEIIIIYLPQYLQYLGFATLLLLLIGFIRLR